MQRIETAGPVYYQFDQWAGADAVIHGVFTRIGGVSRAPWRSLNVGSTVGDDPQAVERNRALMYEALGLNSGQVHTVWQVHGVRTIVATEPLAAGAVLEQADGLVTDRPGLALVMRFADCVPVLLYDPTRQVVGIAHAGWRGTVAGVATSVVQTMREQFGCRPEDIQAGIGPSIGPDEYQVGEEVAAAVRENMPDPESLLARSNGAFQFDLWEANRRILEASGVTQIELAGISTARRTDEFYSHRAEHGRTGRFGAVICLNAGA